MIYADPIQEQFVSGQFYESSTYALSPDKLESDYSPVRFERELRIFRKFCPSGAVLDVGCSTGAFLYQLQRAFPNAYSGIGMDVAGSSVNYASTRGIAIVPFQGGLPLQVRNVPGDAPQAVEHRPSMLSSPRNGVRPVSRGNEDPCAADGVGELEIGYFIADHITPRQFEIPVARRGERHARQRFAAVAHGFGSVRAQIPRQYADAVRAQQVGDPRIDAVRVALVEQAPADAGLVR